MICHCFYQYTHADSAQSLAILDRPALRNVCRQSQFSQTDPSCLLNEKFMLDEASQTKRQDGKGHAQLAVLLHRATGPAATRSMCEQINNSE